MTSTSATRPGIHLRWREKGYEGCRDYFPLEWFRRKCSGVVGRHDCWAGGKGTAICTRSIDGREAEFDYTPHIASNDESIAAGKLRIVFQNGARRSLSSVLWRDPGRGSQWKRAEIDPPELVSSVTCPTYEFPGAHARPKKGFVQSKERTGQQRLRELLVAVYGRCCITRTRLAEALEAAHIDGLTDDRSDNAQNALLLRGDVHRLFDMDLIAIDPTALTVHLAHELRRDPTYRRLDGVKLARPAAGYESYRPDPKALKRRWQRFQHA